jgi:hypothetical protein
MENKETNMDSSKKILKETVERAQNEVKKLMAEARSNKPDKGKLETGLTEVQNELKVMDIHLDKPDCK